MRTFIIVVAILAAFQPLSAQKMDLRSFIQQQLEMKNHLEEQKALQVYLMNLQQKNKGLAG